MSATVLANHFISGRDPRSAIRFVGTSRAWCAVVERAARVAATDVATCLQGESGTGKEVIERFIHASSPRCRGPFIAINCAALPVQLVESELFGSETRLPVFTPFRSLPLIRHNTSPCSVNGS